MLDSVLRTVWGKLSFSEKLDIAPSVLATACSDPSAACRAAAQSTLDTVRIPLLSLTAPLVATSCSVNALLTTDPSSLRGLFMSVVHAVLPAPAGGELSGKRRKVDAVSTGDTDVATGTAPEQGPDVTCQALIKQLVQECGEGSGSSEAYSSVLACIGWKHGSSQGRPQRSLAKVIAAVHELLVHADTASEAVAATCMQIKGKVWQKLLEESVPVLEALQSWSPPLKADKDQAESVECEGDNEMAQVLSALQVRCSLLLAHSQTLNGGPIFLAFVLASSGST